MKKILIPCIAVFILSSCGDSKTSKTSTEEKKETSNATTSTTAAPSGNDAMLTDWLKGKMLTSEDSNKDYNNFKLFADGTCEDKGGAKTSWTIENGVLNIGGLLKINIEKKDENTIILHRSLSDEVYSVKPI